MAVVQIVAAAVMIVSALVVWGAVSAPAFRIEKIVLQGGTFTDEATVRSIAGLTPGRVNGFSVHTDTLAAALTRLPAVERARVDVRLPDTLVVAVDERQPRLIWQVASRRFVIDQDGLVFGEVDAAGNPLPGQPLPAARSHPATSPGASHPAVATPLVPLPTPASSEIPTLPPPSLAPPSPLPSTPAGPRALHLAVVVDRTSGDADLGVGDYVDPVLADAGYRLGTLRPVDLSSSARGLTIVLDDDHGFTLSSVPAGWVAEFGFYSASLRSPTVVPAQVRALDLLLRDKGDAHVAWVWLTGDLSDDHFNAYIPR